MKYLHLVLRNLTRSKRRTILTVLSVSVSVFIFAALISLPGLVNQILRDRANSLRLIAHSKAGLMYVLPYAYRRRMESIPHVVAVSGYGIFVSTYRDPGVQIPVVGIDPDHPLEIWPDFGMSEAGVREFQRVKIGCFVGAKLMRLYGWRIGEKVIVRGTIYPIDLPLTIVGVLSASSTDRAIFFRRDYYDEVLGHPNTVNLFWIKIDSSRSAPEVIDNVDRMFANSSHETLTETEVSLIKDSIGSYAVIIDGARFLAAIVIFTIGLVAANTAAMAVRERRQEIAVMRAIGFPRATLVACIFVEGLAIGIAGGFLGCLLARLAFVVLPYAASALGPLALALKLSLRLIAESFALAAAIGAISALLPALLATRGAVADSIRAII